MTLLSKLREIKNRITTFPKVGFAPVPRVFVTTTRNALWPIAFSLSPLLLFSSAASNAEPLIASYPSSHHEYYTSRDKYFIEILSAALENSGYEYSLTAQHLPPIKESRSEVYLKSGRYTVHWLMTDKEKEQRLRPIRIPLYKGLIGWRMLFIRQMDKSLFESISDLDTLKKLPTAQGHDWPDYQILKKNKFLVHSSASWNGLFEMLELGRTRYLPRSIIEIFQEASNQAERFIIIEDTIVLHYPAAYYYFVSNDNPQLALAIETGLNKIIESGVFEEIFLSFHADAIKQLSEKERKIFSIDNPFMHELTPAPSSKLWFQLDTEHDPALRRKVD